MVKISDALLHCRSILEGKVEDPMFESEVLACEVLKTDRLFLKIHAGYEVDSDKFNTLADYAKRRADGEPSAYITGHREFMSLDFKVNCNVLIPRPDTEILVEAVINKYKNKTPGILDLCTGSGAIACSLAHYIPGAHVTGVDISSKALCVAKENAVRLEVSERTEFLKCDVLQSLDALGIFDVVVSNPPYIESDVIGTLSRDVKDYEPVIALDGGKNGLDFYTAITDKIDTCLKKGGEIYFETGFNQTGLVAGIMKNKFSDIRIIKDFGGNNRVVSGQLV